MDFEIPDKLKQYQLKARNFVTEQISPTEAGYVKGTAVDQKSLQAKLKDSGLWAAGIPSSSGGIGLGLFGQVLIEEEIGRSATPCKSGNEPAMCFLSLCDANQQKLFLAPAVAAEKAICFALTESGSGSDIEAMKTSIEVGDQLVINGSKSTVVGLGDSDQILVVGKKAGAEGSALVACVVDKSAAGVKVGAQTILFDGTAAWDVVFESCAVPATSLVGPAAGVNAIVEKTLTRWEASVAARSVGMAKRAVEMLASYSKSRITFGDKLSNQESIQFKISDSGMAVTAAQYMLYAAAAHMDAGLDMSKEIAAAKIYATEAAVVALNEAIQVHGAKGLSSDLPLTTLFRRARQFQVEAVPTEVLKRSVVFNMLKGNYLLGSVII